MNWGVELYENSTKIRDLVQDITSFNKEISIKDFSSNHRFKEVNVINLAGSCAAFIITACRCLTKDFTHLVVMPNKEQAAYLCNDMEVLFDERDLDYSKKTVLFYPSTGTKKNSLNTDKRPLNAVENANITLRLETLNRINNNEKLIVVTYPEAIKESVPPKKEFSNKSSYIIKGQNLSIDNLIDILDEYAFERVDFVTQSGQYAIRGGIIDIFSYSLQKPCRIEMFGDKVESLRTFDIVSQMSIADMDKFVVVPNLQRQTPRQETDFQDDFFSYFDGNTIVWTSSIDTNNRLEYSSLPQPAFNNNFDMFADSLQKLTLEGYDNHFMVKDPRQKERIEKIIQTYIDKGLNIKVNYLPFSISQGFVDREFKQSFFTDHQLFNRYHTYTIQDSKGDYEQLTLADLVSLKPGDYVTHLDYGVGKFGGLEKITTGGKQQETIRLIYKNNDILYVSIHSLHKISRYSGKEGVEPKLNRLGSSAWHNLKQKTKKRVKDIAKDLIALYAKRKAINGYAFSGDSYLQNELEASFMYEDTVDQYKATKAVKYDMEMPYPMDRLICGDVGFGKTEVAIRAAFKAVCDSKQVAVLVPTTILAFQHYKTFSERLKDMPCRVNYLNRFRTGKEKTQVLKDLKDGKIDILIGTHRIVGKDVHFKDLGLLIIDEEQKFGVSIKEKLRQMKVNIDTLTLTATPIPRTLQFSLMGARDLSIINTAPANRQPIKTAVSFFNPKIIKDAIMFELSRGGQVFFVHNRVQNIYEMASLVERLVPKARVVVGHGQMEGKDLEKVMMDFINQEYDVLVATTIVENGLDIPNVNTIIINDAQNYGLSDLHQLRGRVGRSNKKAYCYLLVPSEDVLTDQAYKRLQAIEEFSSIGSGFAIAMRDLDIRGAGNILGAEQSGFISEIGYDMYTKILSEAMQELREDEFKDLFDKEENVYNNVCVRKECTIETDLEVLIPDYYITNITERLKFYKELDSMNEEYELDALAKELKDRFGKIPKQTLDLFDIVRVRSICAANGIDKIVLRRGKMVLYFNDNKGDFSASKRFERLMLFVGRFNSRSRLKEEGNTLQLTINDVNDVREVKYLIHSLFG